MVSRRKFQRKRRYVRKVRRFRKKRGNKNIAYFTRTMESTISVLDYPSIMNFANPGTSTVVSDYFQLSDLPNYTEFTNLFDKYRITGVKLTFIPTQNTSYVGNTGSPLPLLGFVYDTDDGTLLTNRTDYYQYKNFKIHRLGGIISKWVRPRTASSVYAGIASTAYRTNGNVWIDCDNAGAEYYGCKYYIDPIDVGTGEQVLSLVRVVAKVYIQCKDPR